jgi:formamidopyrimidine-DNA glycosylase
MLMLELPDLQVFSKNLNSLFRGKKLLEIKVINGKKLKDKQSELSENIEGIILQSVYRTGNELRFHFKNKVLLGMQLMLHGNLHLFEKNNENKYTIAELHFKHKGLALTDFQELANIKLNPEEKKGIDALSDGLNYNYLKTALQSKAKIKNLITNQDVIRGIGNAYADEILWEAKIHPTSISSAISENKIVALEQAIKSVLINAEEQILKKHPHIITGEIRDFLKIHTSEKKVSPTGALIRVDKKGGRCTYYTDEQELFV